jgi:hypothetical protein
LAIRATKSDKTRHEKWQDPIGKVRRAALNATRQSVERRQTVNLDL